MAREEAFRDHPERFTLPEGFNPTEFNDMARGQTCAFYCAANALLGRTAEVRRWETEVQRTQWSHNVDCDRMMATTYQALHDWPRDNSRRHPDNKSDSRCREPLQKIINAINDEQN